MREILKVNGLVKNYGDINAVQGISFVVNEGDFFAFLGPNGAGKSTTINIICTLLDFDSGQVTIDGLELGIDDKSIRERIGVVFQDNVLDKRLSVKQNLAIRGSFYGLSQVKLNEKIAELSKLLSLESFINQKYGTLSGGQRRKSDIARALINTPKLLILDEPTTGLDPKTRKEVWEIINKLREDENITIFLTTHYMEEASSANQVVIINNGRIIANGTPEQLRIQYSHDTLKLIPRDDKLYSVLKDNNIDYIKKVDLVEIKIKDSLFAIDLLNEVREYIEAFEVVRGSMDDVFINITGIELGT